MVNLVHQWDPDDWEEFAHSLLQARHGVTTLHKVPAAHVGDFGIDYYCTADLVIYQCYAVEEPIDMPIRAERQKTKITTDLRKMVKGATGVSKLFLGKPVKNWVLLVPNHDSKEVNLHCAKKTADMRGLGLTLLDPKFEVCIHDQTHFPGKALQDAMSALSTLSLNVAAPTKEELENWEAGSADLVANATTKLAKRLSGAPVHTAVTQGIEAFLHANSLIDLLRNSAPDLHERVTAAIQQRARVLNFAGPQGGPVPGSILHAELDNLTNAIKEAAPSLSNANAQEIALGTVSEWIMRCPLDFPNYAS